MSMACDSCGSPDWIACAPGSPSFIWSKRLRPWVVEVQTDLPVRQQVWCLNCWPGTAKLAPPITEGARLHG
jgi:hypothetical protein